MNQGQVNQRENLFSYHEVFANSIAVVQDLIKSGRKGEAKDILIFNYVYAAALNEKAYNKEKIEKLRNQDIHELVHEMVAEQKRADLVPTQSNFRDSYYRRIISKIKTEG